MAEEIEVYKKAFDYACRNSTIDRAVSNTIIQLENRYTLKGDPHHDNQVLKVLFNEEIFQTKLKTAIDEKSKQEEAFEKLKKAVTGNKKIIKQIEGLKRNKGIAIIGNNHDLISGIASYLWLTSPLIYPGTQIWLEMSPIRQKFFDAVGKYINGKKGFCYINCDGVNETELHKELFKDIVTPPGLACWVLFLRNINNSHDNIVKRLLGAMRDVGGQGNFIISTDNLPEDLKVQFEPIYLEPEKQDTAKQAKFIPFPTPSGTQWHEVKISFTDNENVKLSARDKTENRHYSQMGFKDGKSSKSIFLWKFLKELASLSGRFTNCPGKQKGKVKKYFSDLRKALNQLFKIEGNPVPFINTKDYKGYKTAFIIGNKSYDEYENSTRDHLKEYVPPQRKHICKDENESDEFTDNSID